MNTDEHLIRQFQRSRNPADLNELVRRHVRQVHGLAFKMTGNQASADDITQDVFAKAIKGLATFKHQAKFATWLYRIEMNTIFSWLDKHRKPTESAGELNENELPCPQTASKPERVALQTELREQVDRCLSTMKPDFRAAIVLTAFNELSPGEAAEVAGCTKETFYWRLHEARKQLKQQLQAYLSHE